MSMEDSRLKLQQKVAIDAEKKKQAQLQVHSCTEMIEIAISKF